MNKAQILTIALALGLFGLLYFGFDTKPAKQKEIEKTRSVNAELTSGQALLNEARKTLTAEQKGELELLEAQSHAAPDSLKLSLLKKLAGKWYDFRRPDISGFYAMEIADIENTEEAWSISGTTFSICLNQKMSAEQDDFCKKRAVSSFENAISLNPENAQHQVNLAMIYANYPLGDPPMKGILMLLDLNKKQPENVLVLKTLAGLGLQTNQFDKALGRLEKAKQFAPEDREIDCLLERAYKGLGQADQAAKHAALCAQKK